MNIKTNIPSLLVGAALLTACSDDLLSPTHTVGEANNAITLRAGINEGSTGVQTRAAEDHHSPISDEIGGGHKTLPSSAKITMRVDGTWLGKENNYTLPHGKVTSHTASQTTNATVGSEITVNSVGTAHNDLTFAPAQQLYWDDYGTADPANMPSHDGNGREQGLTIYAVAVDDTNPIAMTNATDWTNLSWTLPIDQKNGWAAKDLMTSNNITESGDGTLKFDDVTGTTGNTPSNLLEFTHAMSKITVRLIAGDGFPTDATGTVGATTKKFITAPEVKLTGDEGNASTNAWANTKCNVNVETGAISNVSTPAVITMLQGTVPETQKTQYTAIYEGLVVPGSIFGAPTTVDSKEVYPVIARINADGNIYYVTSEKIRAKMHELNPSTNYTTESGKNYIITVTVNKTEIKVTATITDWVDVEAAEVSPVINVNADFGNTSGATTVNGFSFYRSTELLKSYGGDKTNEYYPANAIAEKPTDDATKQWPFKDLSSNPIKLYWPSHNTHYQFRGVWPQTSTQTTDIETVPHVKALTDNTQVIGIKNVKYEKDHYPSDLMIARPEIAETEKCTNKEPGHTETLLYDGGICATEGLVKMNFRYVMSQVEVELQTSDPASIDYVNIGANTKVEIVNVYNDGYVKLGDREVVGTNSQTQTYTLDAKPIDGLNGDELTTAQCTRHSAIMPQNLLFDTAGASTNTRFKITVTNSDYTKDIYYADIKPILVSENGGTKAETSAWESGKHYKYTLTLKKTEIKVTATLTDWIPVTADQDIWF